MVWIMIILGYLTMAYCVIALVKPDICRKTIEFFSVGSRIYLGGILRLIIGIILLILATRSRLWGYVVAIGLFAASAGAWTFFSPLRRTKKLLTRIQTQPDYTLRAFIFIALASWALLIYALLP